MTTDENVKAIQDQTEASIMCLHKKDSPVCEVHIEADYVEAIALLAHIIWGVYEETSDDITLEEIGKGLNTAMAMIEEQAEKMKGE